MSLPPPSSPHPHQASQIPLHPPSLIPSALQEPAASDSHDDLAEQQISGNVQVESQQIEAPPDFAPFFTLVSNTGSSITHHPTVHYIFSDDTPDSDPVTAAALRSLDPLSDLSSPAEDGMQTDDGTRAGAKERYVLLDMDAAGMNVLSAQSMNPDWAVTSTEIAAAPTWDDQGGDGGLMLKIEGMEVPGDVEGEGDERGLEELVDFYEKRMGELKKVVDAGAEVGMIKSGTSNA